MKTFAVVLLGLTTVLALPLDKINPEDGAAEEGWFVPQLDGSLKWMTMADAEMEVRRDEMGRKAKPLVVEFYLYTSKNPTTPQKITLNDVDSLKKSNFNKKNPTRFIIHGWQNSYKSDVNVEIRSAFMASGEYNVISVNWEKKAGKLIYSTSASYVPEVGKIVAEMIDFLVAKGGISIKTLNLIGHSLGAHAAGHAGKNVSKGKVPVIIGLDPALPLFNLHDCSKRLCATDATYVESIQTNGGLLGFLEPIGKAAFYPNGGKSQPGCGIDVSGICSHSRSYLYYAEAIKEDYFMSLKCEDWKTAVKKACKENAGIAKLGDPKNFKYASGTYLTPVNKKSPYGIK